MFCVFKHVFQVLFCVFESFPGFPVYDFHNKVFVSFKTVIGSGLGSVLWLCEFSCKSPGFGPHFGKRHIFIS